MSTATQAASPGTDAFAASAATAVTAAARSASTLGVRPRIQLPSR